jgi:hypothetical membrane protein
LRYAAVAAPIVVIIVLLIQGATTPGYDPVAQTISELGRGWGGTRIIGLYGFILITCGWEPVAKALATKLSTVLLITAFIAIGLGCFGLAASAPAAWPWRSMGWEGRLHLIFAFGFVFAWIPVACLAASRALPAEWRGLRAFSLATGFATFAFLGATITALQASPPDRFVVSHLGALERIYVFAFLIWQCIVSANLLRFRHKGTR